jgi:hypothetical protein
MSDCDNIGHLEINCIIGNQTKPIPLRFEEGETPPYTPIDLSVYTVIQADITDMLDKFIHRLSLGDGIAVSGDNNEYVTITLSQEVTDKLQGYKKVKFDLLFQTGSGVNWYILKVILNLIRTNTRTDVS